MHEVTLRPIAEAELADLTDWVRPGCLLSLLFHKNPKDPFIRAVKADIAAGQVQVVNFAAVACAHGPEESFYVVLLDEAGWFLYLDGETLNNAEYGRREPGEASSTPGPDADEFPHRGELVCAPRSGVVLALKFYGDLDCDCDRELDGGGFFFQSMMVKSSWERLTQDLAAAAASRLGR